MLEKGLHLLVVAREDEDDLASMVLHLSQEKIEDGTAGGRRCRMAATGRGKLIRLVDEDCSASSVKNIGNKLFGAANSVVG